MVFEILGPINSLSFNILDKSTPMSTGMAFLAGIFLPNLHFGNGKNIHLRQGLSESFETFQFTSCNVM